MGVSNRCRGRSLLCHLRQKNIDVKLNYKFDNVTLKWSGTATVFGTTYQTTGKRSKSDVEEHLMYDAESFIYCNLPYVKGYSKSTPGHISK
jgi:hypothetical protein